MARAEREIRYAVLDVDDVVLDTDAAASLAGDAVSAALAPHLGASRAAAVRSAFARAYEVLIAELRSPAGVEVPEATRLRERIRAWQRGVELAGHEVKRWSRDSLLAIALEDAGVPVRHELVTPVRDRYWRAVQEASVLFPDAVALVAELQRQGVVVHLATNSDGFLVFDEAERTFRYDPDDARTRKLERLEKIAELGVEASDVTIGDPIGKPERGFYLAVIEALARRCGGPIDLASLLVVGDSLTNDVLPFLSLGQARGVWLVRARLGQPPRALEGEERVWIVGDLREVPSTPIFAAPRP